MRALILVDLQNDFVDGGALAVPGGEQVIGLANQLMPLFALVVATQDWHPPNHGSFASQHENGRVGDVVQLAGLDQVLWPDHCVQNTFGAEFVAELDSSRVDRVFAKGTDVMIDSYSGFFDNGHRKATGLGDFLKQQGVTSVYVLGLATDYCVKFTALDARQLGFETHLIVDACRGVDLNPGDVEAALQEMTLAGVQLTDSTTLPAQPAD